VRSKSRGVRSVRRSAKGTLGFSGLLQPAAGGRSGFSAPRPLPLGAESRPRPTRVRRRRVLIGSARGRRGRRRAGAARPQTNLDHQTVRIVLTADFSNPIVAPARPITDRPLRGENDYSRSLPRPSSPWLERYVAGPSDHRPRHARASEPPDQTWLAGVYDQGDFDDVVGLLTSTLDATDSTAAPEAGACFALAPKLFPATVACPAFVRPKEPRKFGPAAGDHAGGGVLGVLRASATRRR
jgi:hypothetical protein